MAKNNFPATVAIVIIFAGAIFLLSGLCTAIFAVDAENPNTSSMWAMRWYEAIMFGSIVFVPSGLMLWAGIRQGRRGANKISGIIFSIIGLIGGLLCLYITILNISDVIDHFRFSGSSNLPDHLSLIIWAILIPIIGLLFCAWFIRVGVLIIRSGARQDIKPETFD